MQWYKEVQYTEAEYETKVLKTILMDWKTMIGTIRFKLCIT